MKKFITLLLVFVPIVSSAQVALLLDTLQINRIVYFHTFEKYDTNTGDSIFMRLCSEYEEPSFVFKVTIHNNTSSELTLFPFESEWSVSFEIDNIKYNGYISMYPHDTLIISPFCFKNINFLIAPNLFYFTREVESKELFKLSPIHMKDRTDYSNIIYQILSTFRLIYKQKDMTLISDTPNTIILNKYDKDNLERYEELKSER